VRVCGHEAGEQPGGGAAVPEQRPHLLRGRRRDADLAGAAAVGAAAGLAEGEPGRRLGGEEPAHGGRLARDDGLGGEERARRRAVARQSVPVPRRLRSVRERREGAPCQ
jgi:hypothetical protein